MLHHVALTAGIPWSSQGRVSVISLVRMLKALQNKRREMTQQTTGTHKESSEGLNNEHNI
jgi:hypothetical protein